MCWLVCKKCVSSCVWQGGHSKANLSHKEGVDLEAVSALLTLSQSLGAAPVQYRFVCRPARSKYSAGSFSRRDPLLHCSVPAATHSCSSCLALSLPLWLTMPMIDSGADAAIRCSILSVDSLANVSQVAICPDSHILKTKISHAHSLIPSHIRAISTGSRH